MDAMSSNRFGEVPEWEGEVRELFPVLPSFESWEIKTPTTAYALAHVIETASMYDPDFLDELNG